MTTFILEAARQPAVEGDVRVWEALQYIPADCDRNDWVQVGMAIKSEFGDSGFDMFDTWSKNCDKYNDADTKATWRSIKGDGGITVGTLVFKARQYGYEPGGTTPSPVPRPVDPAIRQREQQSEEKRRTDAATKAKALWDATKPSFADHPYLKRKGVKPCDSLREIDVAEAERILGYKPRSSEQTLQGRLLVAPIVVHQGPDKSVVSVEMIDEAGRKTVIKDGRKAGGYWSAQQLPADDSAGLTLLIGEGIATILSAKEATGHAVLGALACHNLKAVGMQMRQVYPKATLIFLGEIGAGAKYAEDAAVATGSKMVMPRFQAGDAGSDFNDMAQHYGMQAVRDAIDRAGDPVESWPEVQALMAHLEPEDYPLDAMPARIRSAVEEVAGYVQAPLPLVASSALAAVSLAAQAHVDVQRDDRLEGPTSLYMLTIAASGERKSTCDGYFTQAIRTYEAEQAEAFKPVLKAYRADFEAWEMERAGISDKIRQLAKEGKDVSKVKDDLQMLEGDEPELPRVPRLMYGDATPEALAHKLGTQYPSGGIMAAEGGTVLGSHGMGRESATRNLAQLNVLWDGGTLSIDRRTSESFTVAGARLTIGLMVQEPALRDFLSNTGDLARGSGFLARVLVAWPTSTQGSRMYKAAPKAWPSVAAFNQRIDELLRQPVPMDEEGRLTPALMTFTPEAKVAWIDFYNVIEAELGEGGELRDVRDIASKTADNAARLAALFQHFEDGSLIIGAEAFDAASRITAWHLYEARRFYGALNVPGDVADAVRLSAWLIQYCQRMHVESIGTTKTMQLCTPAKLRKKDVLQRALVQLVDAGHIKLEQDGKGKTIRVNPALLLLGGKAWH